MKTLQENVQKVQRALNLVSTPELCCLDLASEVGEVAKEVLELTNYGKRKHIYNPDLARELGDAFYSMISLANIYDIDLKNELERSLQKYRKRESQRDSKNRKVTLEPIVLAKNFLSINAIAGCRNNCVYCYKHGWDIKDKFIPKQIYNPQTILKALKRHKYYHPRVPLAIHNSATDPFQTGVTETTFEILDGLEKMKISNVVGLITKEYLSKNLIKKLESYKYIRLVIFVTFSCLPKKYENVINDRRLATMKNLKNSKLKKVLYFRPIIKDVNDNKKTVKRIIELGENYFDCIVRSSVKLDINTVEYMAKKGLYVDPSYDIGLNIHDSLKQMPADTRARVDSMLQGAKIPYFKKTSCAISYLFKEADYNTQWVRKEYYCSSSCPKEQKAKCHDKSFRKPNAKEIKKLINTLNLNVKYEIQDRQIILKGENFFYSDIKFMRMVLGFPVLALRDGQSMTAEEYDRKYVNVDRTEIRKQIKKIGILGY